MDPGNSSPVVAYLASEASSWLSGQVLRVQGNTVRRYAGWDALPGGYVAVGGGRLDANELGDGLRRLYGALPSGIDTSQTLATGENTDRVTADQK